MGDAPLRKIDGAGGMDAASPRRGRGFLGLVSMVPVVTLIALVIGVGARLSVIAFEWGWDLFGWAS